MITVYAVLKVFIEFKKFLQALAKRPGAQAILVIIAPVLLGGVFFFHHVEGMSYIDSFYYCVVTLTTVGYGDFVPQTALGKIFTILYIILGIGLFAAFFTELAQAIIEQRSATQTDHHRILSRESPTPESDQPPHDDSN